MAAGPADAGERAQPGRARAGAAAVEQPAVRRRRSGADLRGVAGPGRVRGLDRHHVPAPTRNKQVRERRRQARHPARQRPELVADRPGQVYTRDITKLAGPVKGSYFDAYMMIDIYSRYIVGARVHARESGPLAEAMIRDVFDTHGVPHVVHAHRGTSMTSKSVADLLEDLTVTRSHSPPKMSNDNPYSEAWFKTLKYAPVFPDRFASLAQARAFMTDFVTWCNHAHRHAGIGLHTPAEVHYGRHHRVRAGREDTLATARAVHPERFSTTRLLPKILDLPEQVWTNKPEPQRQAA
ncbi:transposase [Micromonospora wenchangensis]|uniref:transposase n=1 Tax=Micromonospora wenchangensis TaxID=1185415 RepID=UPI003F4CE6F4